MNMPALAVLAGLLLIVGFAMSHSVVKIEGTGWESLCCCGFLSVCPQDLENHLSASTSEGLCMMPSLHVV